MRRMRFWMADRLRRLAFCIQPKIEARMTWPHDDRLTRNAPPIYGFLHAPATESLLDLLEKANKEAGRGAV